MENRIIFKGYKCFKDETVLEKPSLINLIIGRNNCGKTTITEIIEHLYSSQSAPVKKMDNASLVFTIDEPTVRSVFSEYEVRNPFTYPAHSQYFYGTKLIGKQLIVPIATNGNIFSAQKIDMSQQTIMDAKDASHYSNQDWNNLAVACVSSIKRYNFYKIAAERDILLEDDSVNGIDSNGNGVTNTIDRLLNVDGYDYSVVSEDLLSVLNTIMEGENHYTDITTLRSQGSNKKTICLVENGNRIKLNEMGSGLKTILFVLLLLLMHKKNSKENFFIFEELENNLHPEIQRRLFNFIYEFTIENGCHVFLTSHSHVAINCFYGKENASLYRVYKKNNGSSAIDLIESYIDKVSLLDDLGVKASDIFQSNGIIWVEGPSDRIYIKKWIEIFDNSLIENQHYTFLYYGGKILSHFTAKEDNFDGLISILLTNRNSLIVMDHDEESEETPIRSTKQRVKEEMESKGHLVWITKGREIENYINVQSIEKAFDRNLPKQVEPFEMFVDYINDLDSSFASHKAEFANKISKEFDDASLDILDLRDRISEIVKKIKEWNALK